MQSFTACVNVDLGSVRFGTNGMKSCRDGYISSLQYDLYDNVYAHLSTDLKYSDISAHSMTYKDAFPIALLMMYNDIAKVHIDLQVQSYTSFATSFEFVDDLEARYPNVKIGVRSEEDSFSKRTIRWYTFDGDFDAITASWWMILIDRDAIYATLEEDETLYNLMVKSGEYYANSFYDLWQDKSAEPPMWQWITCGCGPLSTNLYMSYGKGEGPSIIGTARQLLQQTDLKSMFPTDLQTV